MFTHWSARLFRIAALASTIYVIVLAGGASLRGL
jgi:hypothetical protein